MALADTLFCVASGRAHQRPPRGAAVVLSCPCGQAIRVNEAGQGIQPRAGGRPVLRHVARSRLFGWRVGDTPAAEAN